METQSYNLLRNIPRFRKNHFDCSSKDIWKDFIKKNPEYKISHKEWKKLIKEYNIFLADKVVENVNGVQLPHVLGHLMIFSCDPPEHSFNFKRAMEYKKPARYLNLHTDGRIATIGYCNNLRFGAIQFGLAWKFTGDRRFKKKVSIAFSKNHNFYIKIPNYQRMRDVMKGVSGGRPLLPS